MSHILRNFIRYSRPHLDSARPHNDWELLIAAQHHGVPTRLLDWTYSPLVAAFFATRPTRGWATDEHGKKYFIGGNAHGSSAVYVHANGHTGGCNTGGLLEWAGTLHVDGT